MSVKDKSLESTLPPFCATSVAQSAFSMGNACLAFWFYYKYWMLEVTRIPSKNTVLSMFYASISFKTIRPYEFKVL